MASEWWVPGIGQINSDFNTPSGLPSGSRRIDDNSPRTQYNRNLTIRLEFRGQLADSFTFPIKPGEFQSDHPARVTTTQTLQGVYQDFGGLGVQKLTYQGNTGWRRRAPNAPHDGFEVFQALYKETYLRYHQLIQEANDPSEVKCLVIDDLYDTVYEVSLDDFKATKSRSTPLLYNYTIPMTVITSSSSQRQAVEYEKLPVLNNNPEEIARAVQYAIEQVSLYHVASPLGYKVQSGDNLESIAIMFRVDKLSIVTANALQSNFTLIPGQILVIPIKEQ
jgi:LysM repeat protein